MNKRGRKDKLKYKNKIRKQQISRLNREERVSEDDCGVSDETMSRMKGKMLEISGAKQKLIRDSSLEKMSEILLEYAKPLVDVVETDNIEYYEKAIKISIMLWNCTILQETTKSRKEIMKMLKPVMPDAESKSIVNYMLERKRQMYPDNKRVIMSYELSETAEGFHLSVASTVTSAAAEKYTKSSQNMT